MKILFASLLFIVGTGFAQASISQIENTISIDEILLLANAKVSDKTILLYIETNELGFVPTAAEIETLKNAGVGEKIIQRLLQKTTATEDDSHDKSEEAEKKVAYVDPYPFYYYNPYYYSGAALYVGFDGFPHSWFTPHFTHATHRTGGHNVGHSVGHSAGHNSTHSIAASGSHILSAPNNVRHNQRHRNGKLHINSTGNRHGSRAGNFGSVNSGIPHQSGQRNRPSRQHAGSNVAPHRGNNNAGGVGHINSGGGGHINSGGGHSSSNFGGHSGGGGRHGRGH